MNTLGLHARPAMAFVDAAAAFKSHVWLCRDGEQVDGKSIMQIMMLAATKGTTLELIVEGEDAEPCLNALAALVQRGFDED